MAFDKTPSTWLGAGYDGDGTNHLIKLNTNTASSNKTLELIEDSDAHETTGDIRKIALAISEAFWQAWLAQGSNLPSQFRLTKTSQTSRTGDLVYTYHFQFTVVPPDTFGVAAEP